MQIRATTEAQIASACISLEIVAEMFSISISSSAREKLSVRVAVRASLSSRLKDLVLILTLLPSTLEILISLSFVTSATRGLTSLSSLSRVISSPMSTVVEVPPRNSSE